MVDVGWTIVDGSDVANDGVIDQICMLDLLFGRQSLDLFVKTSRITEVNFFISFGKQLDLRIDGAHFLR